MYKVNPVFWPFLFIIDILGYLFFFWKKLVPFPKQIKKILVIRLDHLGDVILSTPVFEELRKKYPKAEIGILCTTLTKPLSENNPNIDKIYEFNSPWFSKKESKGWKSVFDLIKKLKKEKFDLIIELHADPRNIIIASKLGFSVGYGNKGLGFLLNKTVNFKNKIEHIAQRNLDVLEQIGIKTSKPRLEVFIDKKSNENIKSMLGKNKIKSFILIHPITRRLEKNWNPENWIELCNKLDSTIIFSGSKDDKDDINELISKSKNKKLYNFAGLSLMETISLTNMAKLIVTTDTIMVHIASALNKKTIALFGPTSKEIWGPLNSKAVTIQGYCKDLFGRTLPNGLKEGTKECMESITVNQVISAVKKIK